MSPYDGDGDIELEGTEEANGIEQDGCGVDGGRGGGWGAGAFGSPDEEAFGALQKGGRSSFGTVRRTAFGSLGQRKIMR
ncbi:MAG: hypothetical protein NTZ04_01520 [Chloroflexi bacterium]|nr:hypothetical protein [Chloroflexota bacterium]